MNDMPIHLRKLSYFEPKEMQQDSVKVPIWITQDSLDGLCALIHYCAGLKASEGTPPGSFELTMFYRTISSCLQEYKKEERKIAENLFCNKCGKQLPPLEKGESACLNGYLCRECAGVTSNKQLHSEEKQIHSKAHIAYHVQYTKETGQPTTWEMHGESYPTWDFVVWMEKKLKKWKE